jgi:hypothetical protein
MSSGQFPNKTNVVPLAPNKVPKEIVESDHENFMRVISTSLTPEQESRIALASVTYPRQEVVLAVHWHPEFIPMELIVKRIESTFPDKKCELIIPTQHNVIMSYGEYAGVEVDCYSRGFNQKVQLLLHFEKSRLDNADVFKSMLQHTFQYRSSQVFDFIHAIIKPNEEWLEVAAKKTGADATLIHFVNAYVQKIHDLIEQNADTIPPGMIRNKILRDFFDGLRGQYDNAFIDRVQTFLAGVKKIVKANFPFGYFYSTSEIIEEARSLGAGIVIPHPEQFWPILLADYDVDGVEVWNPQSHTYTEFLISVLNEKNKQRGPSQKKLLVFMGDDTHMGEKAKDPSEQNPEKASREIGVQPAWDDLIIRKALVMANMNKGKVIEEYKSRLSS